MFNFAFLTTSVSMPEAVLDIFIAFILLGEAEHLPFKCDKKDFWKNVFKLIVFALLYSIAVEVTRITISIPIYTIPIKILVMTVLLRVIYRISWLKAVSTFVITALVLMAIEPLLFAPLMQIFNQNYSTLVISNIWALFFGSLVVRAYQLVIIITIWNLRIVQGKLAVYKQNLIMFYSFLFGLVLMELMLIAYYLKAFPVVSAGWRIFGCFGFLLIGFVNYVCFYVYLNIIKDSRKTIIERRLEHEKNINK